MKCSNKINQWRLDRHSDTIELASCTGDLNSIWHIKNNLYHKEKKIKIGRSCK